MTESTKLTPAQQAEAIRSRARELGVSVAVNGGTLVVQKTFAPGDKAAYAQAEDDCREVLRLIRITRPGSLWGTDSGSVGGHVGLTGGYCRLNRSGGDMRTLKALR
jgi:hypothetical protein